MATGSFGSRCLGCGERLEAGVGHRRSDTVLRWQRRRFRDYWTRLSRGPVVGRPTGRIVPHRPASLPLPARPPRFFLPAPLGLTRTSTVSGGAADGLRSRLPRVRRTRLSQEHGESPRESDTLVARDSPRQASWPLTSRRPQSLPDPAPMSPLGGNACRVAGRCGDRRGIALREGGDECGICRLDGGPGIAGLGRRKYSSHEDGYDGDRKGQESSCRTRRMTGLLVFESRASG